MCGIAGIVGPGASSLRPQVQRMVASLAHRGPDDRHVVSFDDSCVLGVARLAVVDPPGGRQPILDRSGRMAVACNGEIYGHRALRAELDYPFCTGSDAEVVLALHERHGDRFLDHLPGTFALALWDDVAHRLVLARDRFGERPLYWATSPDGLLLFASEIRGLLASGLVHPTVDRAALAQVVRQGYVPPGHCVWDGVGSLPPAHRLTWDGRVTLRRWWDAPSPTAALTVDEAVEGFRSALGAAVGRQLEADVAVGALLSGGADSSTVAALAGRDRPGLPVFSFDLTTGSSEVDHARAVTDRHGLDLHVLSDTGLAFADLLVEAAAAFDEPFGDSSSVLTWLLCRFARERVTVALTGDGADELLGGYLCWVRSLVGDPHRRAGRSLSDRIARRPGRQVRDYAGFRRYFTPFELDGMGLPAVDTEHVEWGRYRSGGAEDLLRFDVDGYLAGDILVKTDRASMAHGLEVRAPFLDVEVAELCLSLPLHHNVDGEREKVLLRSAFEELWPEAVRRRPKQGFGAPLAAWLRAPDVRSLKQDLLADRRSPLFDLLEFEGVQRWVDTDDQRTWNLLAVALWWARRPAAMAAA